MELDFTIIDLDTYKGIFMKEEIDFRKRYIVDIKNCKDHNLIQIFDDIKMAKIYADWYGPKATITEDEYALPLEIK